MSAPDTPRDRRAAAVAVGVSLIKPPVYEASAMVVVGPREANPQESLSTKISDLQVLAHEMAVLGLNRSMVEDVASAPQREAFPSRTFPRT